MHDVSLGGRWKKKRSHCLKLGRPKFPNWVAKSVYLVQQFGKVAKEVLRNALALLSMMCVGGVHWGRRRQCRSIQDCVFGLFFIHPPGSSSAPTPKTKRQRQSIHPHTLCCCFPLLLPTRPRDPRHVQKPPPPPKKKEKRHQQKTTHRLVLEDAEVVRVVHRGAEEAGVGADVAGHHVAEGGDGDVAWFGVWGSLYFE